MPYGMIHAVLLPPTLDFTLAAREEKMAALAQAMGVPAQDRSLWELRKGIGERLDHLLTDLGAPRKLIWQGLSAEDIIATGVKIGRLALDLRKQGSTETRKYTKENLIAILQKVLL